MTPTEFLRSYEAATGSHDLERTLALIHPDAVYWFSNQTAHAGKDAVAAALAHNFSSIEGESYEIRDLRWLVESDDFASGVYEYAWAGVIQGERCAGGGRGTVVIVRVDGEWRVLHEHLSPGRIA